MTNSRYTRFAKIVCTLGPASSTPKIVRGLIEAGMDVARINLSHGTHEKQAGVIRMVRKLAAEMNCPVGIMADLQGPKMRLGVLQEGGVRVRIGESARFDTDPAEGTRDRIPVPSSEFFELVSTGTRFLVDDGLLEFEAETVEENAVTARVIHGGMLADRKGINVLDTEATVSPLTDKDRQDLVFALQQGVDWIALSFVQSPDNVRELKDLMRAELGPDAPQVPVIAKIEKPKALDVIDEILELADGAMVARGDLGIETSAEAVPLIQKELIRKCNALGKPVITATQMLDSMMVYPRPTRAEASDVANAVLDGTDCIMLSGETAVGMHPELAVETMSRIVTAAEKRFPARMPDSDVPADQAHQVTFAVSKSIVHIVDEVGANAILCPTASGSTAKTLASFRPNVPIIALTQDVRVQRQLTVYRCVHSLEMEHKNAAEEVLQGAIDHALEAEAVREGDKVVLTAGTVMGVAGMTNMMTVRTAVKPLLYGVGVGRSHVLGSCLHFDESLLSQDASCLADRILFVPRYRAKCNRVAAACAGLVTGSSMDEVETAFPEILQRSLPAICDAGEDFSQFRKGQSLILDALSGRLFDSEALQAS